MMGFGKNLMGKGVEKSVQGMLGDMKGLEELLGSIHGYLERIDANTKMANDILLRIEEKLDRR